MVLAVEQTTIPSMINRAPIKATYRRPIRSERDPTKGQTPARASRFARTNQIQLHHSLSIYIHLFQKTRERYVPVNATKVCINIGWDSTCSPNQYLSRRPEDVHTENVDGNL